MWKRLKHRNIVPFLGITSTPLQLISEWMPNGDLTEYIRRHLNTDRLTLVSVPLLLLTIHLPLVSYVMSPTAFTFSTPATWFIVISKEYAIILNPISPPC